MKKNCKKIHRYIYSLISFVLLILLAPSKNSYCTSGETKDSLKYYNGQDFVIIGKYHKEKNYARFPMEYKGRVRDEVWNLGQHAAGISIRFRTNASVISVKWSVLGDNTMDHMPSTGIKGIDLYAFVDNNWKYVNTGRVTGRNNEFTLVQTTQGVYREYLLNLPLYDGVDSLQIGVNGGAIISMPEEEYLVRNKPVVYYGSSIAQGGCASRPGMAFTNILSRMLDRSFINLGFSGNGTFDRPVGEAMCEMDAALYVIDCNPNTQRDLIYGRAVDLVRLLKEKKPGVPVLLVEGFYYENGFGKPVDSETAKKNAELGKVYKTLQDAGVQKIYYLKGEGMIGSDHEGTVDGVHPNDLGMMRIAETLMPAIKNILE